MWWVAQQTEEEDFRAALGIEKVEGVDRDGSRQEGASGRVNGL